MRRNHSKTVLPVILWFLKCFCKYLYIFNPATLFCYKKNTVKIVFKKVQTVFHRHLVPNNKCQHTFSSCPKHFTQNINHWFIFIFGTIRTASKRFFRLHLFRSCTNNFINHLSCVKAFSHFYSSILFSQEIRNISSKLHGLSVMRCTAQVQYSSEPADRNTPDEFENFLRCTPTLCYVSPFIKHNVFIWQYYGTVRLFFVCLFFKVYKACIC